MSFYSPFWEMQKHKRNFMQTTFELKRHLSEGNISNITCIPLLKNLVFFLQEFNLIDRRELAPLQELIEKLTAKECRWNASNSLLPSEYLLTTLFNRFCATAVAVLHSDPVSDWNKQTSFIMNYNWTYQCLEEWYIITPNEASVRSTEWFVCHIKIIIFSKECHPQIICTPAMNHY